MPPAIKRRVWTCQVHGLGFNRPPAYVARHESERPRPAVKRVRPDEHEEDSVAVDRYGFPRAVGENKLEARHGWTCKARNRDEVPSVAITRMRVLSRADLDPEGVATRPLAVGDAADARPLTRDAFS